MITIYTENDHGQHVSFYSVTKLTTRTDRRVQHYTCIGMYQRKSFRLLEIYFLNKGRKHIIEGP